MGDENAANNDAKVLEDARKLGMAQRVEHKMWKVRAEAYDDMKATCQKIMSSDDPALSEYGKVLSKSMADANAPALDKALEAMLAYQAKCSVAQAASICDKCSSSLFTKAMNGRPGTVLKAIDVLLYFIELEQSEKVLEHVVAKGLGHKVPKVVAASIDFLLQSISAFGTKVVAPQAILKALPPHFESRDAKIREKVKATVVELSRWVGAEVVKNVLFDKMREAMQGDISKLIDQAPEGRPKATRITRSEQLRLEAQEAAGTGEAMELAEEEEEEQVVDEFDLSAPAQVLSELTKEFWAGLQEKKWLLRKESLTTLKDLASKPRLASGDYGDVIRELKKVITKDSNVQCIAEACNCAGALAKGLRQEFSSAAKSFVPIFLEKLKEKNPVVSRSIPEALVLMHKHCVTLQDVIEEATGALGHANPKVRQQTLEWLQVCCASEPKEGLKPIQAQLVAGVAKLSDDPMPAIREASLSVLLELCLKAAGVAQIEKITGKLADNRRKKLEEMLQEAKQNSKPSAAPASAPAPALNTSSSTKAAKKAPAKAPAPKAVEKDSEVDSAPAQKGPPPLSTRQPAKTAAVKQVKLAGPPPGEDDAALSSGVMGKEQCQEQLTELFGEETITALSDPVWKKRMEALDAMLAASKDMDMVAHTRLFVNGMATLPGWDEKNFQVMSRQFEFIRLAAENGGKSFGKSEAFLSIKGLVEKMGDIKLKTPAFDALSMICEAVGPQFVFDQVHSKATSHKNPKVLAETLNWMSKAIDEFGLGLMNTKNLINYILVDAASTNPAVKNAAVGLAGCIHKFVGPALGEMLQSGVKPAQMTTIQQAFEKNPQVTDFVPTRIPRTGAKKASGGSKDTGKGQGASAAVPAFDPDELLPRTDISSQITSSLVAQLSDSNWKNRKAALEDIETILSEAGNRIQANTGELMSALKGITKDSNGNLVATGVKLMGKIATAMGKAIDRQGRPMLSPCLVCISDTKTLVRAAVIEMLTAWSAAAGVSSVMPELAATAAAPKCSADGKIEFVKWVSGLVKDDKDVKGSLEHACKLVAVACTDKLATVKSAGSGLMQLLVEKYGSEVATAAKGLDGPTKKVVMEIMQKCGGGASPAEPAKVSQGSSSASSPRTTAAPKRPGSATGTRPAKIPAGRSATPTAKPKSDAMDIDQEQLVQLNDGKDTRARKNRGKRAKYDGIPPNELEMLKSELGPLVSALLRGLLFDADFKKQCVAAEMITSAVGSLYSEIISCLDLIFRWAVIRIVEANTQCLVKTLGMLKVIMDAMISNGYRISEYEAIILLPVLVEKSGHNQDRIKKDHRELMALSSKVLAPTKVFVYLSDGLESKNNKTKVECAEEIGALIDREGMKIAAGQKQAKAFPVIATAVSSRDASFRKACLGTLATVYDFEGSKIWKLLGRLTEQQRSLIEERLKVHSRELAKQGLVPGYRNEDEPAMMEEEVVVRKRASPPQRGAFGFAPAAQHVSPEPGSIQSAATGKVMNPRSGGIPMLKNLGGIPRPSSNSPSLGCAMESSRTASPGTASPLPDPPEANGNYGAPMADEQRSDAELEEVWTRAMITMVSGPITEAIDALKVLCYELMEASKGKCSNATMQLMADSADELVKELVNKLDVVFYDAATHSDPPSNRGCKYTLNTMMQVAGIPSMARMLQKSTLKDTISFLLTLLLDERLPGVHEGNQLMKAMNVLVLRMLDICNKNSLFGLLLEILRIPPQVIQEGPADVQEKFSNLVIKCLIKMTKSMGNVLASGPDSAEFNTTQLLWDIHTYFSGLGMDEIHTRSKEDDKPLKMVKTILHEVCRHKGGEVVRHVGDIPQDEESPIILAYIDLNLQTLHDTGIISGNLPPAFSHNDHVISQYFGSIEAALSPRQHHDPPLSPDRSAASSMSGDGIGPDTMKAELAAIFKKIGDKSMSKEGMVDLYHFQQEHAAVDVMPYLSNTSDAFQAYIERGLQRIHAKRSATQNRTPTSTPVSVSAPSSGVADGDEMEVDEVSECSPRCATPPVNIPTPRSIPRPGGIPRPKNEKPAEIGGDQIRSLKDFRNMNRFGRRD